MGVYIKNMKLPDKCGHCRFADAFDCHVDGEFIPTHDFRRKDCPLTEVPTPHGPLVDSNRLIDIGLHLMHTAKNDDIGNGVKWLCQYIIEAPIILEEEEGE